MATQAQLAEHLDLSQPSIAKLIAVGIFQSAGRGALDLDECRLDYIRHLRDMAAGRTGDETLTGERIRLTKAQANKVEMINAIRAGEILEIAPIVRLFSEQAASVRTQLLSLPSSIAPAVHRCKTLRETCSAIEAGITGALEVLCADPETARASITRNAPPQKEDDLDADETADDVAGIEARRGQGRGKRAQVVGRNNDSSKARR